MSSFIELGVCLQKPGISMDLCDLPQQCKDIKRMLLAAKTEGINNTSHHAGSDANGMPYPHKYLAR